MKIIKTQDGFEVKVSDHRYPEYSRWKWYIDDQIYPHRIIYIGKRWRREFLHRLLLPVADGNVVDHKNGDVLDCQDENLREFTPAQNARNKTKYNGLWEYKGVTQERSGRFRAAVTFEYRRYTVGTFDTEEEAAVAYDIAAFALDETYKLNFPDGHPKREQIRKIVQKKVQNIVAAARGRTREKQPQLLEEKEYIGVTKSTSGWAAKVGRNNETIHVGTYATQKEAAIQRDLKVIELGLVLKLNFPQLKEGADPSSL